MKTTLPTDSNARKEYSLSAGCYAYFPAALAGVARHSFKAGAKHTQGVLEHRRWLSTDHEDCIERHMMDLRDLEAAAERAAGPDGIITGDLTRALLDEVNALAWRALALSQRVHEQYGGAPLAPAARPEPAPATPAYAFTNDSQAGIQALNSAKLASAKDLPAYKYTGIKPPTST